MEDQGEWKVGIFTFGGFGLQKPGLQRFLSPELRPGWTLVEPGARLESREGMLEQCVHVVGSPETHPEREGTVTSELSIGPKSRSCRCYTGKILLGGSR